MPSQVLSIFRNGDSTVCLGNPLIMIVIFFSLFLNKTFCVPAYVWCLLFFFHPPLEKPCSASSTSYDQVRMTQSSPPLQSCPFPRFECPVPTAYLGCPVLHPQSALVRALSITHLSHTGVPKAVHSMTDAIFQALN